MSEQISNILNQCFQQVSNESKAKQEITSNKYIEWLCQFAISYPEFSDDELIYNSMELTNEDKENIKKLQFLFRMIQSYAENHDIFPSSTVQNEHYYAIHYKDTGFQIGIVEGFNPLYFYKEVKPESSFLSFEEIKKETIEGSNKKLLNDLKNLTIQLESLSSQIPLQDLRETTTKILTKIAQNQR